MIDGLMGPLLSSALSDEWVAQFQARIDEEGSDPLSLSECFGCYAAVYTRNLGRHAQKCRAAQEYVVRESRGG